MRPRPMPIDVQRLARGVMLVGMTIAPLSVPGQSATRGGDSLPFFVGERLEYSVKLARVRGTGRGTMSVDGPVDVRGSSTLALRFDFRASVGPLKAIDRTESWLDPQRMRALRFHKKERHPLSSREQRVELFPEERRWEAAGGDSGDSPTDLPLDELSFIYFMRTIPFVDDSVYTFDRHFERERNPVTVYVLGRETITTGVGELQTVLIEMRVHDSRRYSGGEGVIRIHFTDDGRRIPARIESVMPVVGRAVLTLQSRNEPPLHIATRP